MYNDRDKDMINNNKDQIKWNEIKKNIIHSWAERLIINNRVSLTDEDYLTSIWLGKNFLGIVSILSKPANLLVIIMKTCSMSLMYYKSLKYMEHEPESGFVSKVHNDWPCHK